jgi:hypothetical protein
MQLSSCWLWIHERAANLAVYTCSTALSCHEQGVKRFDVNSELDRIRPDVSLIELLPSCVLWSDCAVLVSF